MKLVVCNLILLLAIHLNAQIIADHLVGTYYCVDIKEVLVNDTLEFSKGQLDESSCNKYLIWRINEDNTVKVKTSYPFKRKSEESTILVTTINKTWRFFKETKILYLDEEKYKILSLDTYTLKLERLE